MQISGLALASWLAVAAALGLLIEKRKQPNAADSETKPTTNPTTTSRTCDCREGECCNAVTGKKYVLPHAHVEPWDKRASNGKRWCDPRWAQLAPRSEVDQARARTSFGKLILLRHGQSVWNRKPNSPNELWRYAGSIDIPLSDVGIEEALEAGRRLEFTPVDVVFCSQLDRARSTVSLALSVHSSKKTPVVEHRSPLEVPAFEGVNDKNPFDFITPVYITSALNERNFGDLQGVPSTMHTVLFDHEQIRKIRNDYYTKFPGLNGESCADIEERVIPFFNEFVVPHLQEGRNVLLSTHGFVIRTLIKHLDRMDEAEFNAQMKLEKSAPDRCLLLAPTGVPLMYQYENGEFTKVAQSRRDRAESLSRSTAPY